MSLWIQGAGGGITTDLVFNPAIEASSAPVYKTWPEVLGALGTPVIPTRVWFAGDCFIPGDLGIVSLARLVALRALDTDATLLIGDGTTLQHPAEIRGVSPDSRFLVTYTGVTAPAIKFTFDTVDREAFRMENVLFAPASASAAYAGLHFEGDEDAEGDISFVSSVLGYTELAAATLNVQSAALEIYASGRGLQFQTGSLSVNTGSSLILSYTSDLILPFPTAGGAGAFTPRFLGGPSGIIGSFVRTGSYSLQPGELVRVNMSGGAFPVTLPPLARMAQNATCGVVVVTTGAHNCTVGCADGTIAGSSTYVIDGSTKVMRTFLADVTNTVWIPVAGLG